MFICAPQYVYHAVPISYTLIDDVWSWNANLSLAAIRCDSIISAESRAVDIGGPFTPNMQFFSLCVQFVDACLAAALV